MIETAASRPLRLIADQAFSRTAGAPLVSGNAVRLLKDADENYPASLSAIRQAQHAILFESYIVGNDATGREFRDALAERARAGVRVFALYDWLGTSGKLLGGFWKPLIDAGASVRVFNPPSFVSPLGWIFRDHRKSISVDGRVAYVSGLCVAQAWRGDPAHGKEPWRDTGVEIRGPAVADVERAFAQVWGAEGTPLPDDILTEFADIPPAGDVALRIVASTPATGGLMRLDHLITSIARARLWLTDAYFVPLTAYMQALIAARQDGVDVRILVPGSSDIPILSPLSRAGFRPLLSAGIRIYEWNGPMLHAKTAVADGRWARVGSTNLNLASFVGNYELDVAIEDAGIAEAMERQFEEDLDHASEVVLEPRRLRRPVPRPVGARRGRPARRGSAVRAAAGAVRVGSAVGTAILHPGAAALGSGRILVGAAGLLTVLAALGILWPRVIAWPFALVAAWFALALLIRAWRASGGKPESDSR